MQCAEHRRARLHANFPQMYGSLGVRSLVRASFSHILSWVRFVTARFVVRMASVLRRWSELRSLCVCVH